MKNLLVIACMFLGFCLIILAGCASVNHETSDSKDDNFFADIPLVKRNFKYVIFNVDDYPRSEILKFAHENSELFNSIHLSVISANSERDATRIRNSILNNTIDFNNAALSQSKDSYAQNGGDMGMRSYLDLQFDIIKPADRQNIFALKKGELSGIINNNGYWSFYKAEEETVKANFDDVIIFEKVNNYIRGYQRGMMEDWAIMQAEDFIKEVNKSGFDNAANRKSLEIQNTGMVNSRDLKTFSYNRYFLKTVFLTELNTASVPIVNSSYIYVFFPIDEIEYHETDIK